jgi:hypothetical protein
MYIDPDPGPCFVSKVENYEMAKLENLWKLKCGIILHGPP